MQKYSLTFCLSPENPSYSEEKTEAGYLLCSLEEMFANGIREAYQFPNVSVYVRQAAHLAGIHQ